MDSSDVYTIHIYIPDRSFEHPRPHFGRGMAPMRVFMCVAIFGSVLHRAVCCSVFQCVAVCREYSHHRSGKGHEV